MHLTRGDSPDWSMSRNLYVLLYRPSFLNPPDSILDSQGQIALDAATKSTRVLEDMLSHNLVQHGPPHL